MYNETIANRLEERLAIRQRAELACEIAKDQRSEKLTTHFCLRAFRLKT